MIKKVRNYDTKKQALREKQETTLSTKNSRRTSILTEGVIEMLNILKDNNKILAFLSIIGITWPTWLIDIIRSLECDSSSWVKIVLQLFNVLTDRFCDCFIFTALSFWLINKAAVRSSVDWLLCLLTDLMGVDGWLIL